VVVLGDTGGAGVVWGETSAGEGDGWAIGGLQAANTRTIPSMQIAVFIFSSIAR
jgi:hypothetical protein